ncbi:MAG: ATP phosphoribosyltransferase regulatory subunit [Pseudomonadota bacterium]
MMPVMPWLLPEYIEDVLPGEANTLELLRRKLLDHLSSYGYQWIQTPLIENLDTLITGTGQNLNSITFKVVDQLSGKTLGVRADITPQAARIDSHLFASFPLNRLCYCGSVLHTQPSALHDSREIWQLGAELYGTDHFAADIEILQLFLELAELAGLKDTYLDIGHVGFFESLTQDLPESLRQQLFIALQSKDTPELLALTATLDATTQAALLALTKLYGEPEIVLANARQALANFPECLQHIRFIEQVLTGLKPKFTQVRLDLAELRGHNYHTGIVFALYTPQQHRAIGLGGRYDRLETSQQTTSSSILRPATGFSLDLRAIAASISPIEKTCITAPYYPHDEPLKELINALRKQGECIWIQLPPAASCTYTTEQHSPIPATHQIVKVNNVWQVEAIPALPISS